MGTATAGLHNTLLILDPIAEDDGEGMDTDSPPGKVGYAFFLNSSCSLSNAVQLGYLNPHFLLLASSSDPRGTYRSTLEFSAFGLAWSHR